MRFGTLNTSDPDYQKAKKSRMIAALLIMIAIPLGFIIRPLIDVIVSRML